MTKRMKENPSKQTSSDQPTGKMVPVDQLVFFDGFDVGEKDNVFDVATFAGYAKHLDGCRTSVYVESMAVTARANFNLRKMPIEEAMDEIRDFILLFEGPTWVMMGTESEISKKLET